MSVLTKLRPCLKVQWKNKSCLSALIKSGLTRLTFLISSLQGDESRCLDYNTDFVKSRGGKKAEDQVGKTIIFLKWQEKGNWSESRAWTLERLYGFPVHPFFNTQDGRITGRLIRKVRPSATTGEDVKKLRWKRIEARRDQLSVWIQFSEKRTARAKCSDTPNIAIYWSF